MHLVGAAFEEKKEKSETENERKTFEREREHEALGVHLHGAVFYFSDFLCPHWRSCDATGLQCLRVVCRLPLCVTFSKSQSPSIFL